MKLKLILESVNEVDLSISSTSKLELELSQANVFETGKGESDIPNTDYLQEGLINKYFDENKVRLIFNEMIPIIPSTTNDIIEGENKYFTNKRVFDVVAPELEAKLDKVDYVQHFKGLFDSYTTLSTTLPTSKDGDYAHIDSGGGFDRMLAIWDSSDSKWVVRDVHMASTTDEIVEGNNNLYLTSERVVNIVNPLLTPILNQIGEIDTLLNEILGV